MSANYEVYGIPIEIPEAPDVVDGQHLPKHKQKFYRTRLPDSFKRLPKEDPDSYLTDEQSEFIDNEWNKRLNGYWFMNNGEPTYITGTHYFYLNWWQIDIGHANYRKADRDFFLAWEACVKDPNCYGMVEVTGRRGGKSFRAACIEYEYISRVSNAYGGIQSKNDKDAISFFRNKLVSPWRKLPFFFKPTYDSTSNPKSELRFFAPAKRGKRRLEEDEEELGSWIDARSSVEMAFDGEKLHRYISDESGKLKDLDIGDRWDVVKKCLQVEGTIIGKALFTTTVEEVESGGGTFKKLWDESNHRKERDGNGQTKSGLYQHFRPAYLGYKVDEYGNDLIEESKQFQQNTRDGLKNDRKKLSSEKRKMPWTPEEAFAFDANKCHFDPILIQNRIDDINYMTIKPWQCGNLRWVNDIKYSKCEWIPCNHGDMKSGLIDCEVCRWRVSQLPSKEEENNVSVIHLGLNDIYKPNNGLKYVVGGDPYDTNRPKDEHKASMGAIHVFKKFDPFIDTPDTPEYKQSTDTFVCEYYARPLDVFDFYDDYIKTIHFWGAEAFPEVNKRGLRTHLIQVGYENFLAIQSKGIVKDEERDLQLKSENGGGWSSTPMITHYTNLLEYHINRNIHKMCFPRTMAQWLEFDNTQTTKYDLVVSSGFSLVAAQKQAPKNVSNLEKASSPFAVYDRMGNRIRQ